MAKRKIPTSLEEKGFKSYSQAIREITGWDTKTFETQKRTMRMRVSNLNKLAGTNLSAIEELYYKVAYEDKAKYYASQGRPVYEMSPIQRALQDIKTTKVKTVEGSRQYEIARQYVFDKFSGLGTTYQKASAVLDDLLTGNVTPAEANKKLSKIANALKWIKNKSPQSWATFQDEQFTSNALEELRTKESENV